MASGGCIPERTQTEQRRRLGPDACGLKTGQQSVRFAAPSLSRMHRDLTAASVLSASAPVYTRLRP